MTNDTSLWHHITDIIFLKLASPFLLPTTQEPSANMGQETLLHGLELGIKETLILNNVPLAIPLD